jgi:hypothetical protein
VTRGDEERPRANDDRRRRVAISIEVLSVVVLIGGSFLYLQYNNLASLCGSVSNANPCLKSEVRSDIGVGLMVVGVVGLVVGVVGGWLRRRS